MFAFFGPALWNRTLCVGRFPLTNMVAVFKLVDESKYVSLMV
jgi:hypothetical protein